MRTVTSIEEFRTCMLDQIDLHLTSEQDYLKIYKNQNGDNLHLYQKKDCYELGIADYSIPRNFQLHFHNPQKLIRFGIVYQGTTSFQLKDSERSSFSPSSFFVMEEEIQGVQTWHKGQHFHGIEVTIYASYLNQLFEDFTKQSLDSASLLANNTYHYLPIRMVQCLQELHALSNSGELNPIYLEGKILECLAILYNELFFKESASFLNQSIHETIQIGNRQLRLTATDLAAIQKAYRILSENIKNPPTIDMLSKMVLLNTQKLKAGFLHHYHMTIGDYLTSLRMTTAAILLCTTNDHVHDIALEAGYTSAASFIKMFRKYYNKTPLQYRNENR